MALSMELPVLDSHSTPSQTQGGLLSGFCHLHSQCLACPFFPWFGPPCCGTSHTHTLPRAKSQSLFLLIPHCPPRAGPDSRTQCLWVSDVEVLKVERIQLIDAVLNLCTYHHPENIQLPPG